MAKQRDKNSKDIYQTKLIKDVKSNAFVENADTEEKAGIFQQTEENPRESRQETQRVVKKRTSEITIQEVEKAPKKMKNGKTVGPDNQLVEEWKSLGIIGIEYLKQELNKIMEEEKIPDEWRKST
ncbi:uncharacterized protein [Penaeus vannamei]|uniref:uncharacterized protein n=1 Tax=Penaeus vannamei TaxID=6689 RepID=UPI00387F9E5B